MSSSLAEDTYLKHGGWLYRWLIQRVRCHFRAEDLVHDTFYRVLSARKLETIKEPRPFLARVAHGLMVDECRRRDLEQACFEILARDEETLSADSETVAALVEEIAWIDTLLSGVPERAREIFLMSRLENKRQADIAAEMNVSLSTVEKDLRMVLKVCYERIFPDP